MRRLLLLTLLLTGCAPTEAPAPEPDVGEEPLPAAACVGDGDGVITAAEIPSVDLALALRSAYLVDAGGTELPADWQDDGWRLGLETLPASGEQVFEGPMALADAWFADRFPDGEWQAVIDHATGTRGVFARSGDDVVLVGIASTGPNVTALRYTPPVPLFALPMKPGDGWDVAAEAEGLVDGEEWPQDLGASGVVSLVHRWTFSVDAAGTAVLPGADLPVLRQRLVLRTEAYNSIAGLFAADSQRVTFLVAECLGTVARLRSEVDELDPDFTRTTEILRFGLAAELLP